MVVGVDGSPGALLAVQWAAVEAAGRGLPMRLVNAIDPMADAGIDPEGGRAAAESVLADATRRARAALGPELQIIDEIALTSPALGMAGGDGPVAMICLGSSGLRPARPGHHGSTATEVILIADCPVAIVRGSVTRHGWVVAQVETDPSLFGVLELAVAEAVWRELPLRLVAGWNVDGDQLAEAERDLERRLRVSLDRWRQRHRQLDVAVIAAPQLEEFLRSNAIRIRLFVGPRRRWHDVGTVLHPDVERALRLLDCSVIVGADLTGFDV